MNPKVYRLHGDGRDQEPREMLALAARNDRERQLLRILRRLEPDQSDLLFAFAERLDEALVPPL